MSCYSFVKGLKPVRGDAAAVFFDEAAPYVTYERKNREPHSSVTRLIQNLTAGGRGNTMGGKTIYTTEAALSEMDLGMATLFSMYVENEDDDKNPPPRARADSLRDDYQVPTFRPSLKKCGAGVDLSQQSAAYEKIHRLYLMAAFGVVSGRLNQLASKITGGHAIGAILVEGNGTIAGWSTSTNIQNKSQHAEVNLIQSYFARTGAKQLPDGVHIYSTLKPCAMCAGMIVSCAGGPYRVIYGQDDPGAFAQDTALDEKKTSELVGSGISGQLHLVKANFLTKGSKGARAANQAAGQGKDKVDLPSTLQSGYQTHQSASGGGVTGYLDEWGGHGNGVIGSVADRLAAKIGKGDAYYNQKYGADSAVLAVIRHIEAYLADIGIQMQW